MGGSISWAGVLVWAVPFCGWGPCMDGTILWARVPAWVVLSHRLGSLWQNYPMGCGPCGGTLPWAGVPVVELSHGLGSLWWYYTMGWGPWGGTVHGLGSLAG